MRQKQTIDDWELLLRREQHKEGPIQYILNKFIEENVFEIVEVILILV